MRVYQVTPGVTWTHRKHLQAGMQCVMCHGNVAQLDAMAQTTSVVAMASCISCHQAHNANTACATCHSWPARSYEFFLRDGAPLGNVIGEERVLNRTFGAEIGQLLGELLDELHGRAAGDRPRVFVPAASAFTTDLPPASLLAKTNVVAACCWMFSTRCFHSC